MTQHIPLKHGEILHAGFTGPIQELLSGASINFRIVVTSNTTLKIEPGTGDKQQGLSIGGYYRYRSTETSAALPGSLANGEHPVFVTATANNFGGPIEEPDITTHTFGLEIKKSGETPSTALYRQVGWVVVVSEKITGFRQIVGSVSGAQIENGALENSSVVTWTRGEKGGFVATITNLPKSALSEELQQRVLEPGDLKPTYRKTAPAGWLLCDGSEKLRATYPALWEVLKETGKNNGNGTTTFTLPLGTGATFIGADPTGVNMKTLKPALGAQGGEERHELTVEEMPYHAHAVYDPGHTHGSGNYQTWSIPDSGQTLQNTYNMYAGQSGFVAISTWGWFTKYTVGNSSAAATGIGIYGAGGGGSNNTHPPHNNVQPFFAGNWLIKT